jgi:hypothetical protein
MEGHMADIGEDRMHQFLSIITCVGSSREMRLEAINREAVREYRMQYMEEKVGKFINPEEGDEVPKTTKKKPKMINSNATPQELKRMRQNFYSQFYLLNGLSKLRNLKEYSNR